MKPRRPQGIRGFVAALALGSVALAGCAGKAPQPAWQGNAKASVERSIGAYLAGNTRVDDAELARARSEVAATGRVDLMARVELSHCAAQVASLVFGACAGFEALRVDAAMPERAYADYLQARLAPPDIATLPEAHRRVASIASAASVAAKDSSGDAANAAGSAALAAIADPLSRLVAAGVLLESGSADPKVVSIAIDTASAQGWRRPLLAWLGVQLKLAERAGASDEVQRLQRRIALVQVGPA
jgi:hypothetical protein